MNCVSETPIRPSEEREWRKQRDFVFRSLAAIVNCNTEEPEEPVLLILTKLVIPPGRSQYSLGRFSPSWTENAAQNVIGFFPGQRQSTSLCLAGNLQLMVFHW